jgi:hypothetical protein
VREAASGGETYLLPVRLDDYVLGEWAPTRRDLANAVPTRVITDFCEHSDVTKFQSELAKLITVLKRPVAHL